MIKLKNPSPYFSEVFLPTDFFGMKTITPQFSFLRRQQQRTQKKRERGRVGAL